MFCTHDDTSVALADSPWNECLGRCGRDGRYDLAPWVTLDSETRANLIADGIRPSWYVAYERKGLSDRTRVEREQYIRGQAVLHRQYFRNVERRAIVDHVYRSPFMPSDGSALYALIHQVDTFALDVLDKARALSGDDHWSLVLENFYAGWGVYCNDCVYARHLSDFRNAESLAIKHRNRRSHTVHLYRSSLNAARTISPLDQRPTENGSDVLVAQAA